MMLMHSTFQAAGTVAAPSEGTAAWVGAGGTGLSALVALLAVYIAYRALRATKETAFTQLVVTQLFEIMRRARDTRSKYVVLFKPFENEPAKAAARGSWMRAQEEVTASLDEIVLLVPAAAAARESWKTVEDEEDSHVTSKLTRLSEEAATAATKRYDASHDAFIRSLTDVMKALR